MSIPEATPADDTMPSSTTRWEPDSRAAAHQSPAKPLTVEEVVFSLDRVVNATFPPYKIRQKDFVPNFAKVEKIGDWKIRVTSRKPEPLFETLLNIQQLMIVPKRYMASLSGNPGEIEPSDFEAFGLKPGGTGPYRITEFVPNQRLVYERFDGFWGERAPFARITLRHIPSCRRA